MNKITRLITTLLVCALLISGTAFSQGRTDLGIWGFDQGARFYYVTADFTTASASLVNIPGLSFPLPANAALTVPFSCEILYSQATAAAANIFGIQAVTTAPINIMAKGEVWTSAAVAVVANVPTLASTSATNIVTFTPSAITTVWNAKLSGVIENASNATTNPVNLMVLTGNGSDAITIKRGSFCKAF